MIRKSKIALVGFGATIASAGSALAVGEPADLVTDAVTKTNTIFATVSPLLLALLTITVAFTVFNIVRKGVRSARR